MLYIRTVSGNFILHLICVFLYACASGGQAPVVSPAENKKPVESAKVKPTEPPNRVADKPASYTVRKGDTLYSIAWNYGLDYRYVAGWNGIHPPYTIYPGQKIRLNPPQQQIIQKQTAPKKKAEQLTSGPITRKPDTTTEETTTTKSVVSEKQTTVSKTSQGKSEPLPNLPGPVKWLWPTQGKVVKGDTPISKNGIDITGMEGQDINAAAGGDVVYSGSGLLGYGRLIIIKHNDTYLSAYAHNKELLVNEGERVTTGQKIALMGRTNDGRTLLHFEIRKNGQPVNPLSFLPGQ